MAASLFTSSLLLATSMKQASSTDLATLFGHLRSLMHDTPSGVWFGQLVELLEQASELAPEAYQSQWIPYLNGFPDRWSTSFMEHQSLEQVQRVHKLAPFIHSCMVFEQASADEIDAFFRHQRYHLCSGFKFVQCQLHDALLNFMEFSFRYVSFETLTIQFSNLENWKVYTLTKLVEYSTIRHLDLSSCGLSGLGLKSLLQSHDISSLETLVLSHNELGPERAKLLAQSNMLRGLKQLSLQGCGLSPEEISLLQNSTILSPNLVLIV